jgi:hypothetical protein
MNKDERHGEYSHRQAPRDNIPAPDVRSDHTAVVNVLGIETISHQDNTSSTATRIIAAATATNQPAIHSPISQDAAFLPSHEMHASRRCSKGGSNSDDSSSLGDKSFDSIVNMLLRRKGEDRSIATANMYFQTPASLVPPTNDEVHGQQGEAFTTMSANLLAHSHQDQTMASKVWPALYSPSTFPPPGGRGASRYTSSSPSWGLAGGGSDTSNRADMAAVIAAVGKEDHIAMYVFNTSPFSHFVVERLISNLQLFTSTTAKP